MIVDMIRYWSTGVAFLSDKLYSAFVFPQIQIPEIWAGSLVTSLCGDKFIPLSLCGRQFGLLSALAQISDLPKLTVKGSMRWEQ